MQNLALATPADDLNPVPVADVRDIPLEQLQSVANHEDLLHTAMTRHANPARVDVAMFSSAI